MTRYTVTWKTTAIDELAGIWAGSPDRAAVTTASDAIDKDLAVNPETKGTEYRQCRLIAIPPLWALFVVHSEDRQVEVLRIGQLSASYKSDDE